MLYAQVMESFIQLSQLLIRL